MRHKLTSSGYNEPLASKAQHRGCYHGAGKQPRETSMFEHSIELLRRPLSSFYMALLALALASPVYAQSITDYQEIVDAYLAERGEAEGISGVSVYISLGDPGPAIELFAGTRARTGAVPVSPQICTAAVDTLTCPLILKPMPQVRFSAARAWTLKEQCSSCSYGGVSRLMAN